MNELEVTGEDEQWVSQKYIGVWNAVLLHLCRRRDLFMKHLSGQTAGIRPCIQLRL